MNSLSGEESRMQRNLEKYGEWIEEKDKELIERRYPRDPKPLEISDESDDRGLYSGDRIGIIMF